MSAKTRIIVYVILGAIALGGALVARSKVTARNKRVQAEYKVQQQRDAQAKAIEAEAKKAEGFLVELQTAVQRKPGDVKARWHLADAYQTLHKIPEAREELAAIPRLEPSNKDALLAIANADLATSKVTDAEREYRQFAAKYPKEIDGWQGLAAALYHQGRYREAGDAAFDALKLNVDDYSSRYTFASSALEYAAQFPPSHVQSDALIAARVHFERMKRENPDNGDILYKLGRTCFYLMDRKSALKNITRAHELLPDRADIAYDLSQTLIADGKRTEAKALLDNSILKFPKMAGLFDLRSEILQMMGDPASLQLALSDSQTAVLMVPKSPTFLDRLGAAYVRLKNFPEARKAYEASILIDGNRTSAYQQLAAIYTRLGDQRRASLAANMASKMVANDQLLRRVQELDAKYPDQVDLQLNLADRYLQLKNYGAARDTYLHILRIDPANPQAKQGLQKIAQLKQKPLRKAKSSISTEVCA
jgi:cytochrome c-type biogenesis protein CcmH/NrfG